MKKYSHVNQLSAELDSNGFVKGGAINNTCIHSECYGDVFSLTDSIGNQLIGCEDCKYYYIILSSVPISTIIHK